MIKKIIKLLKASKNLIFPKKLKIVNQEIGNSNIKILEGTIPTKPDYDDAWFYELSKISNNLYDIGSNIGFASIVANLNENIKNIILVDPNPKALAIASKNLILNNLAYNCNFYLGFVGEKSDQKIKFYTLGTGAAGSMYKDHAYTASKFNKFFNVKTITIDDLFLIYKWVPDLVKIDVEAAEYLVLKGSTNLAKLNKTRFLVEMHSVKELSMNENAKLVLDWCFKNNYLAWYLKKECILKTPDQIAHRGRCHLLIQPKCWDYPQELKGINQGQKVNYNY